MVECQGRKPNHRSLNAIRTNAVYCSLECRNVLLREIRSKTAADTNRRYASERMRIKNPMRDLASKARMQTTLRAMGWMPPVQGGNGKPPPVAQMLLASALGWEMEVAVPTRQARGSGYPTCYKLDMANRDLRIGVEVDGPSHCSLERQAQDRKKEELLQSLGWKVLRFSNEVVIRNLNACVREVLSSISK
jgi:hypothetical protein